LKAKAIDNYSQLQTSSLTNNGLIQSAHPGVSNNFMTRSAKNQKKVAALFLSA
jgi:hypothetical protein